MGRRERRNRRRRDKAEQRRRAGSQAKAVAEEKTKAEIRKIDAETLDLKMRFRLDVYKALVATAVALGSIGTAISAFFGS